MKKGRSFPEPLEALLLVLATFGALIVFLLLFSIFSTSGLNQAQRAVSGSRYFYILGGSLFLIVPLLYARWRKYPVRILFRFNPVPLSVVLASVVIGLSLSILSDELERIIALFVTIPDWMYEMLNPLRAKDAVDWILVLLGSVVIAAIAEEGLFRGFVQVTLEAKGDVTRAVLLTALTWTLVHQNPYWAVELFITGVFLGFMAWRSNSILPGIIAHGVNNLVAMLMLNFPSEDGMESWYEWNGHVSPVLLITALAMLIGGIRWFGARYRAG
jgi:membrane protease YdiL (CAAX protease family)